MRKKYNIGIMDCIGWSSPKAGVLKYRIYTLWRGMLSRCYYGFEQEKRKACYKECRVCERWHTLSNFAKDIVHLPNYDLWANNPKQRISLDKDFLIPGNREYNPNACCFLTASESSKEAIVRNIDKVHSVESRTKARISNFKAIICTFPDGREEWLESARKAEEKYGFSHTTIAAVCKGKRRTHHQCSFRYA